MVDVDDDNVGGRRRTSTATRVVPGRPRPKRAPTRPRRRRPWRPQWQGVARLGLLIGLVAFGTVVFSGVRERTEPAARRGIDRLDPEAIMVTIECHRGQDVGAEENFALSGGLCSTYEDRSMRIVNGITLVVAEQPDRDGLTVTGTEGWVNADRTEVTFTGDVRLRVTDGLAVRTDTLVYSKERGLATMHDDAGPTTLTRTGLEAEGRHVTYENDRAIINLEGAAKVRLTGDEDREAIVIRSARAILANADRYMRFEAGTEILTGSMVLGSETTTAHFGEEETALERLELHGGARIYATEPVVGGLREMRATEMTLRFEDAARVLEGATLAGASTIELVGSGGDQGARISAATMEVILADGGDVTALEAWDDVRLQLPTMSDGARPEIRAGRMVPTGAPGAAMTSVRFEQDVTYREQRAATPTAAASNREIRAERLEAGVEEGLSALVDTNFQGDVRFTDDTRQASADEAVYDLVGSVVTLTADGEAGRVATLIDTTNAMEVRADVMTIRLGQTARPAQAPEVVPQPPTPPAIAVPPPEPTVSADVEAPVPVDAPAAVDVPVEEDGLGRAYSFVLVGHEVSLDGSRIEASGGVTSVLKPGGGVTADSTSGKMPALLDEGHDVLVSADALRYDDDTGQMTYTGQAHLWQGLTSFEGDTLTMDDQTGSLMAAGNVRTSIQIEQLNETTGLREVSTSNVTADTFDFDNAGRHAVYTKAQLTSDDRQLKADTIDMFIGTDGRTLDRLMATGTVKLGLPGRWTTADHLEYDDADGRYDLEGTPVVYEEEVEPEDTAPTTPVRPGATPPPPPCQRSEGPTFTFTQSSDTSAAGGREALRTKITSVKCTPLVF